MMTKVYLILFYLFSVCTTVFTYRSATLDTLASSKDPDTIIRENKVRHKDYGHTFVNLFNNVTTMGGILGEHLRNIETNIVKYRLLRSTLELRDNANNALKSKKLTKLQQYDELYRKWNFHDKYPKNFSKNWRSDDFFVELRTTIFSYHLKKLNSVSRLLRADIPGIDIQLEVDSGKIYIIDYEEILSGINEKTGRYGKPSWALFRKESLDKIKIIAIKAYDRIYYPSENASWLLAKMFCNSADIFATIAESFINSRLFLLPFKTAMHEYLRERNPIYQFIEPHLRGLHGVTDGIIQMIFSENSNFDNITTFGSFGIYQYINREWNRNWKDTWFLNSLKHRGLENIEGFEFTGINKTLYSSIYETSNSFVNKYYPTNNDISKDTELMDWFLSVRKYGNINGMPTVLTKEFLKNTLTEIMIRSNYAHFSERNINRYGMMLPFIPFSLYKPFGLFGTDPISERDVVTWLPNLKLSIAQINFTFINTENRIF